MGIISKLFGSDSVIDAGINSIDALVFTDEEKSTAKMKFLKLYEPYKIAQRWLMMFVCVPYVMLWSITGFIYLVDIFTPKELDTSKMMVFLNGDVGSAFILIVAFYFGSGAISGIFDRFKK